MTKRYLIGKSHVTFTGGTLEEIEAKKNKYEAKKGISPAVEKKVVTVKRKKQAKKTEPVVEEPETLELEQAE